MAPAEAERRAWATVNQDSGGGNSSDSGRGLPDTHVGAEHGGRAAAARKGAETRRRNAAK